MSDEDYEQGFSEGYDQGLSTDKEKSFLILAARIDELKKEITRLRAELVAVTAERDRMWEALKPFDGFPLHKWDGIGDDHVLYGPFTLGHVRKYLSASCQGLLDNSNYPEKPDSCARAALEGVTEPASPWRDIESAPRDGTAVVGCSAYKNKSGNLCYNWIADGYFDERGDWYFANSDFAECGYSEVTHWMPLPEPPR